MYNPTKNYKILKTGTYLGSYEKVQVEEDPDKVQGVSEKMPGFVSFTKFSIFAAFMFPLQVLFTTRWQLTQMCVCVCVCVCSIRVGIEPWRGLYDV